ncbi:MAG: phosphatase PAP2 family protein [Actinobacteria bacterium]|nr:MAG: phosphatase PAP2 family protein [Actinomycetota bacterium]
MRSRSLLWSFNYAIEGIVYALKTQRNMRIHVALAIAVLVAALALRISALEFIALLFAISLVIVTELVNTALENAVDLAVEHFDPAAKAAKDVAAGAVLLASVSAVAVGYVVFFGRISGPTQHLFAYLRDMPAHLTIIALGLAGLLALAGKWASHTGTWLSGGWPSGHTALAMAAAASIGFVTRNVQATLLALFVAALVAQSRVESERHTVTQVVSGAVIGFLAATFVFQVAFR